MIQEGRTSGRRMRLAKDHGLNKRILHNSGNAEGPKPKNEFWVFIKERMVAGMIVWRNIKSESRVVGCQNVDGIEGLFSHELGQCGGGFELGC